MPLVSAAARASDLDAAHSVAVVGDLDEMILIEWSVE
jgi:hypothetical protein